MKFAKIVSCISPFFVSVTCTQARIGRAKEGQHSQTNPQSSLSFDDDVHEQHRPLLDMDSCIGTYDKRYDSVRKGKGYEGNENANEKWVDGVVPYLRHRDLGWVEKSALEDAMQHIMDKTEISFNFSVYDNRIDQNYFYFRAARDGLDNNDEGPNTDDETAFPPFGNVETADTATTANSHKHHHLRRQSSNDNTNNEEASELAPAGLRSTWYSEVRSR